eukprot:14225240-Alexandrium_andersonii.AAC.1
MRGRALALPERAADGAWFAEPRGRWLRLLSRPRRHWSHTFAPVPPPLRRAVGRPPTAQGTQALFAGRA